MKDTQPATHQPEAHPNRQDRPLETGPLYRLHHARWTLATAAAGLVWIIAQTDQQYWRAVAVMFALVLVTMIWPRRRKVTRLRVKAEARRRSFMPDRHMRTLAAALPDPCFIIDPKGIVRFANKAGSSVFGTIREGDPISFRIRQPNMLAAMEAVQLGGTIQKVEFNHKNHSERMYEAWFTPIHLGSASSRGSQRGGANSANSNPDFILLLFHDQTEQKNTERMRADFVANASHELRTPLASLIGFIETLQGPAKDDSAAQERFLAIMLDQAERMSRLISDLLSLSRIEMKAHMLPDSKVDLTKVIRHVTDALTPLANDMEVVLETDFDQDEQIVIGEQDELVQVVENLIENALKYGKDGKKVLVSSNAVRDGISGKPFYAIKVRDFGPGIPQEHLPRLTERFYRIDAATSREQKGTGLGLAIVKHILMRHRGHLIVDSVAGEGTTFQVRLPIDVKS
ncbi:MAG: ATP-binding protein [Cohaesibacter sp.]|jgi:two-component system phosphate regulon sensor histidine kinase PhoR|nr:ATP-binding protein [Cohaesibacter sp.]